MDLTRLEDLASWLNANQGVLLAVYTFLTLLIFWATMRSVREIRRTREVQYRPLVVADLDVDPERHTVHFVLRNAGASAARNVSLSIDPAIHNPKNPHLDIGSTPLVSRGFSLMVAGKEHRTIIGVYPDFPENGRGPFSAVIRYQDDRGRKFEESVVLSLEAYAEIRPPPPKSMDALVREVEKVSRSVAKMADVLEASGVEELAREFRARRSWWRRLMKRIGWLR